MKYLSKEYHERSCISSTLPKTCLVPGRSQNRFPGIKLESPFEIAESFVPWKISESQFKIHMARIAAAAVAFVVGI